jgi:hypothetical protein
LKKKRNTRTWNWKGSWRSGWTSTVHPKLKRIPNVLSAKVWDAAAAGSILLELNETREKFIRAQNKQLEEKY